MRWEDQDNMAVTKLLADVNNIQSLSDRPNTIDGLTSSQLKELFDKAGADIKTYINETLTEEIDEIVETIPDSNNFVTTSDSRLTNSRQCNNTFDNWNTSRTNLKITYGTTLPNSADNGAIFFLYKQVIKWLKQGIEYIQMDTITFS